MNEDKESKFLTAQEAKIVRQSLVDIRRGRVQIFNDEKELYDKIRSDVIANER